MKLLRYMQNGTTHLGVFTEAGVASLDGLSGRFPTMMSLIAGGAPALDAVRAQVAADEPRVALNSVRLLAPLERPGKYLAIGMNYRKHAEEAARLGVAAPANQLWFNKQTTCLAGPHDDIDPGVTEKLDYEVELAVVIGGAAKHVAEGDAPRHVFGYVTANDVSARDWQFHSQTFTMGNTEQLIHSIWKQISYLSTAFTLEPGDLLATGTPEGVGVGMTPPRFLQPGDVVRCEIDGIGAIENRVIAPARA